MAHLAWRLAKFAYISTPLDGEGARLYGSRWTSPGRPVVYFSTELGCAALEVLVHIGRLSLAPADYRAIGVSIPATVWRAADTALDAELPRGWQAAGARTCVRVGDAWLNRANHAALLRVPSAVVQGVTNLLLDPQHPDASSVSVVSIEPFTFDPRLFGAQ